MLHSVALALLFLFAAACTDAPAHAGAPEPTRHEITLADIVPMEDWYGIYVNGAKNGWMRIGTTIKGEGAKAVVVNRLELELKTLSLGHHGTTRKVSVLEFEGKAPFRLLRARGDDADDDVLQTVTITRRKSGYRAEIKTGKARLKRNLRDLDYTLADWATTDVWIRRGPSKGATISVRELDLEKLQIDVSTFTLLDTKSSRVRGVDVVTHDLDSINNRTKIKSLVRVDRNARLLLMNVSNLFEARLETEAEAKATTATIDLFALGSAKLDRPIGVAGGTAEVVTLKAHGRDLGKWIKSSPSQKVDINADGTLTIRLARGAGPTIALTAEGKDEGLAENVAYPISNPRVKALAREAVGEARTDREKLERIVAYVNRYIRPSLESAAPRLLDLLDRRSGDCKSFAMLVVALARAAGLPAREVSGLVYMGDNDSSFGGHAWAEVAVDGTWIGADASVPIIDPSTTHIRYGAGDDGSTTLLNIMGSGGVRLELLDVQRRR